MWLAGLTGEEQRLLTALVWGGVLWMTEEKTFTGSFNCSKTARETVWDGGCRGCPVYRKAGVVCHQWINDCGNLSPIIHSLFSKYPVLFHIFEFHVSDKGLWR